MVNACISAVELYQQAFVTSPCRFNIGQALKPVCNTLHNKPSTKREVHAIKVQLIWFYFLYCGDVEEMFRQTTWHAAITSPFHDISNIQIMKIFWLSNFFSPSFFFFYCNKQIKRKIFLPPLNKQKKSLLWLFTIKYFRYFFLFLFHSKMLLFSTTIA